MFNYYTDGKGDLKKIDTSSDIANCLLPLLDGLGWKGDSEHILVEALPHNTKKIHLTELLELMANLKYESKITDTFLNKIESSKFPCLFLPKSGSAKVLLNGSDDSVLVFDGEKKNYAKMDLSKIPGLAVFFDDSLNGKSKLMAPQKEWFYKVLSRFKATFLVVFLLTVVLNFLIFATPLFIISIYDKILVASLEFNIQAWIAGVVIFIIASAGFSFFRSQYINLFSVRIGNLLGQQVLRRLLYLSPRYIESASLSDQISRIKDYEHLRDFLSSRGPVAVLELLLIMMMIGLMFVIGGPIAYIPIVAIVLYGIFGIIITPLLRRANEVSVQAIAKRQEFNLELIHELRSVKYINATDIWAKRYKDIAYDASIAFRRSATINAVINVFSHMLISLAGIATMGYGVILVLDGVISPGAIIACFMLIWRVLAPLNTVFNVITQFDQIKKSIGQLDDLMTLPLEDKAESKTVSRSNLYGSIKFSKVSLRYSQDSQPALVNIDFDIKQGSIVQIIGPTGSGKTTLFKLIMGMYTPQVGRVFIDNMNIRQIDQLLLRRSISYLTDETHFIQGTINQNLQLVKPSVSPEELEHSLEKAALLDDIKNMPDGLGTKIKESNVGHFSTAFRRRFGISRSFLRESSIMLLDSPDKGLTEEQNETIIQNIAQIKGKSTVLIASENVKFFDIADQAIWIDEGRVKMIGNPQDIKEKYYSGLKQVKPAQ